MKDTAYYQEQWKMNFSRNMPFYNYHQAKKNFT